jgi:hypothetical protein
VVTVPDKITPDVAKKAREGFLADKQLKMRQSYKGGRIARDRLDTGMLVI